MKIAHRKCLEEAGNNDPESEESFGTRHFDCPEITRACDRDQEKTIEWKIHPPEEKEECLWVEIHHVVVEGIISLDWENYPTTEKRLGKHLNSLGPVAKLERITTMKDLEFCY